MINLFIITSPLQLINAIEAKDYFKTNNNKLVAIFTEFKSKNKDQILRLIDENEWEDVLYFDMRPEGTSTTFFRQIKLVKLLRSNVYDHIFCGDLSSSINLILSNIDKRKVYLVDDGATTINRHLNELNQDKQHKTSLKNKLRKLRFNIFGIKTNLKDTVNMFTSYNLLPNGNEEIIKNNLSYFKENYLNNSALDNSVYFLGNPLVKYNMISREKYFEYVSNIKKSSKNKILYIPHRSESDFEDIKKLEDENFEIYYPELPIELELIFNNIYPSKVYSFFSSALFTLNIIFEKTDVVALKINKKDFTKDFPSINNVYQYIEEKTSINIIKL